MAADALLAQAVLTLSEHCDGAHSRDGAGFNGPDAKFGNSLAVIPPEAWDKAIQREAWEMLHKYKAQLAESGIDYDAIPEPEAVAKSVNRGVRAVDVRGGKVLVFLPYGDPANAKSALAAQWNRDLRGWVVSVRRYGHVLTWANEHKVAVSDRAKALLEVIPEGAAVEDIGTATLNPHTNMIHLAFEYDIAAIDSVRALPERHWDAPTKQWLVPATAAKQVKEIAAKFHLTLDAKILELPDIEVNPNPRIGVSGSDFTIGFNYDAQVLSTVRQMPGSTWQPLNRVWSVPIEAIEEVIDFIRQYNAQVSPIAQLLLDENAGMLDIVNASSAHDADIAIDGFGSERFQLFPFQRAGVSYAMRQMGYLYDGDGIWNLDKPTTGGILVGDEMGLGKTSQALGILKASNSFPAIVVCPAVVKPNWAREIQNWIPGANVKVINGTSDSVEVGMFDQPDVYVVNYDVLSWYLEKLPPLKGMVLDESHYIKNGAAQRSKACIALSDKIVEGGVRVCLSGTPILNRPTEIMTQLRVIKRLEEFGGATKFKNTYAKSSARALAALNRKLRSSCYVRRRKIDVLTELPPKVWATLTVEGDSQVMIEYRKAEDDIIEYLAERARELALASGATTEEAQEAAWEKAMRAEAGKQLVIIGTLKQIAARAKMRVASTWIADFLENDKKLVVFGWHRPIVDEIATNFANGIKIQGAQDANLRQRNVDLFQESDEQKVISCQIKAAGVGITLTAASDVLFLEQGWNPGEMEQAADRCHRIGQQDSVTAWLMLCENTIDETIADLIAAKRIIVDRATDGSSKDDEEVTMSIAGDLLVGLARRGLARKAGGFPKPSSYAVVS